MSPLFGPLLPSVLLAVGCSASPEAQQAGEKPAAPSERAQSSAAAEITAAELEASVRFLASDALGGRDTGTPEGVEAAKYLAQELARAGVRPAGDDGTFLQRVPLERVAYAGLPVLSLVASDGPISAAYGIDFDQLSGEPAGTDFPVRFAHAEKDPPLPAEKTAALFLDGSSRSRREWLERAGTPDGVGWGLIVVAGADKEGTQAETTPPRTQLRPVSSAPRRPARIAVRGALRERFRRHEVASLKLAADVVRTDVQAFNVVGRLEGSGDTQAAETIVFSAHYDHLGTRAPAATAAGSGEPEDVIFNGADDDASGCAAVLELAEALATRAPVRTLVFLLVTGEERGLLGTDYYLAHPAEPLERTVCNLNFEMIGRPDELAGGPGRLWLTGFERSNLGAEFQRAGLALVADPRPDQNFFQRSDNYAFAVRGIVAQTLSSFNLHTDYHQPSDEADTLDYAHMEACVRASLTAARALADGTLAPRWNEGGAPPAR